MNRINILGVETTTSDYNKIGNYYKLTLKMKCLDNKIRYIEYIPNSSNLTVRLESSRNNRYYSLDKRLPERLFGKNIYDILEDEYIKAYNLNNEEAKNLKGEFFRREPADMTLISNQQKEFYVGKRIKLYIKDNKKRPYGLIIDNSEVGIIKGLKKEGLILTIQLDSGEVLKTSIGNIIYR